MSGGPGLTAAPQALLPLLALFQRARLAGLAFPRVRLRLEAAGTAGNQVGLGAAPVGTPPTLVLLTLAGARSKQPGSLNVTSDGGWLARVWYGRVTRAGRWEPSRDGALLEPGLGRLLQDLARDPAGVAARHGLATGECCWCGRGLTDRRSVRAGFGPRCAEKYGLRVEWERMAEAGAVAGADAAPPTTF